MSKCIKILRAPGGSEVKNPLATQETQETQVPSLGGNDTPLQYFCLENSMDSKTLQAIVHGVSKSQK